MQTFLPYPSFARTAAVLDDRRLGRQRVETLQVLRALHLADYGWAHHPAVLMWRGHGLALVAYGLAITAAWSARGAADTTRAAIAEFAAPHPALEQAELPRAELPCWLGWEPLHRSHRSALVRKDPAHYRPRFADAPPDLPYVWPRPRRPAPEIPPRSAWVVRAATAELHAACARLGAAGVPAAFAAGTATRKQRRQLARFVEAVGVGDRIALPEPGDYPRALLTGAVSGPAVPPPDGPLATLAVVRDVRWTGQVARAALRRPYQLQDPQTVFALHGEPAVES